MIEKRYQVFISSTFRDLIDERQAALKAVLELDHMPAGMELFPAADDSAWQLISDVIDSSDYYVLLVGGRYGSLDEAGLGYTEKEYHYAVSKKKPVIPLLHKDPDNLPREKTETDPDAWEKLQQFRDKVESAHTCVYWDSPEELKAKLIVGLTANVKRHPAVGWVRADTVPTDATIREVLDLKTKLNNAQRQLEVLRTEAPPGTEDLMQGDDTLPIKVEFVAVSPEFDRNGFTATVTPSWNEIFAGIAPTMINEASDSDFRRAFLKFVEKYTKETFADDDDLKEHRLTDIKAEEVSEIIETSIVQLRALGLMKENAKKRSIKDTATYWTLTPFGDRLMVQLRALHKKPIRRRKRAEKATHDEPS